MESTLRQEAPTSWFQDALRKGLVLALIHIILFVLIYFFIPNKLGSFTYLILILVFNISYCIISSRQWRELNGGYLEFKDAFLYNFVLLTSNGLINMVFSVIFLFAVPDFPEVMAQSQLDTSLYWAAKFGAPQEALDKVRDEFNFEDVKNRFSFVGLLISFGIAMCFYAVGAVIVAPIVKKSAAETF